MSRLIVKNLPNSLKESELRDTFSPIGELTEVSLKHTPDGKFRNFGFVGYKTPESATEALKQLNNTFIHASKIRVEFCKDLSKGAYERHQKKPQTQKKPSQCKKRIVTKRLSQLKDDKEFRNFVEMNKVKWDAIEKLLSDETPNKKPKKIIDDCDFLKSKMVTNLKEKLKHMADDKSESEGDATETGRLMVRNLPYTTTQDELEGLFNNIGPVSEVHLPIDSKSSLSKGFAFVTFLLPEHAVKALNELDGSIFQGRMLHLIAAKPPPQTTVTKPSNQSTFKTKAESDRRALSANAYNWNTLFLGVNAVADAMAQDYKTSKAELLDATQKDSLGVRMALGETQVVSKTKQFLVENCVCLDSFGQAKGKRSRTTILVKNLPNGADSSVLRELFSRHGPVKRLVLPPHGVTALVEFCEKNDAKLAFKKMAYTHFENALMYLEWAPIDVFSGIPVVDEKVDEEVPDDDEPTFTTLFVKNLNFETTEDELMKLFSDFGRLKNVVIARRKDSSKSAELLSMGYGFVEFERKADANAALKRLQHHLLRGHSLQLKISERNTLQPKSSRKRASEKKQKSSKIMVRNIPFQASVSEVKELFQVFGSLKNVRVPKKLTGGSVGTHRGFGFVDFASKKDAKRAFDALCHSTHLYGRRLVLEWAESDEVFEEKTTSPKKRRTLAVVDEPDDDVVDDTKSKTALSSVKKKRKKKVDKDHSGARETNWRVDPNVEKLKIYT